eukprot:2588273-Pleurochrysis_carterae.AAC.2
MVLSTQHAAHAVPHTNPTSLLVQATRRRSMKWFIEALLVREVARSCSPLEASLALAADENALQPLFLKVSFHRPHPPYDPPRRWLDVLLSSPTAVTPPRVGTWEARLLRRHECSAANGTFCGPRCGLQADCGRLREEDAAAMRAHYLAALGFVDEQAR